MRPLIRARFALALFLTTPAGALAQGAALTPPAGAPDREKRLVVKQPAAVREQHNDALGASVLSAADDSDAVNAVYEKLRSTGPGARFVRTEAGIGVVALGSAPLPKASPNANLNAMATRKARVEAVVQAKHEVLRLITGSDEKARIELARQRRLLDSPDDEAKTETSQEERQSVVNGFLVGAMLWDVVEDAAAGRALACVASTPRSQGFTGLLASDLLVARDIDVAKDSVRREVRAGATPPDGGLFVVIQEEKRVACLAWGSALLREGADPAIAAQARVDAEEAARQNASAALLGLISGETIAAEFRSVRDLLDDMLATNRGPREAALAKTGEELVAKARSSWVVTAASKGSLPRGVQWEDAFTTADGRWTCCLALLMLDAASLARLDELAQLQGANPLGDTVRRAQAFPVAQNGSFQLAPDGRLRSLGRGPVTPKKDL